MRYFKRLVAMMMVMVMALACTATAFAAEADKAEGTVHELYYGRSHAAPSCRLYPGSNGADEGTVNESVYEAGAQAAGLYRCWPETDRVEGLDGSGEGSADGDRSAA